MLLENHAELGMVSATNVRELRAPMLPGCSCCCFATRKPASIARRHASGCCCSAAARMVVALSEQLQSARSIQHDHGTKGHQLSCAKTLPVFV
jgi:hypothetical protein